MLRFNNFTFILIKKIQTRITIKFLNIFREHLYLRISHPPTRILTNHESRLTMAKPRIKIISRKNENCVGVGSSFVRRFRGEFETFGFFLGGLAVSPGKRWMYSFPPPFFSFFIFFASSKEKEKEREGNRSENDDPAGP